MGGREGGRQGGREGRREREREGGAIKQKEESYLELLETFQNAGYTANLVTVEVGSRGVPNPTDFLKLRANLGLSRSTLANLMVIALGQAITGSFKIWCMRNQMQTTP